ncbi:flagellar hook-length control protein FliK, partial [Phenylobacterium sp.]|uniref:flagellar hook-length control protein FliK n=1 Tax=Phenylobacterium sp. TaxID=1871053 RepID=UPI00262A7F35
AAAAPVIAAATAQVTALAADPARPVTARERAQARAPVADAAAAKAGDAPAVPTKPPPAAAPHSAPAAESAAGDAEALAAAPAADDDSAEDAAPPDTAQPGAPQPLGGQAAAPLHAPPPEAASLAAPQTVAALAAQMIRKLDGRTTRFDVQLDPAGLGHVDVRVEIGAHGRITAALWFDNPQAARELAARADELAQALQQAGFDLTGGLSFDVAGDRGRNPGDEDGEAQPGAAMRGRAFQAALTGAGDAIDIAAGALRRSGRAASGVDIRI